MSIISSYIVPHPPITIKEIAKDRTDEVLPTINALKKVAEKIASDAPETLIVVTPHATIFGDYFHISPGNYARGDLEEYGAKEVSFDVEYDKELAEYISSISVTNHIHSGGMGNPQKDLDYATMIALYYINKKYTNYRLIRVSIADFTPYVHYQFGKCISEACNVMDRRVTVVASGDLSHYLTKDGPYGYRTEGPIFDSMLIESMKKADFMEWFSYTSSFIEKAGVCGLKPFSIMAGTLDGRKVETEFLSYQGNLGVGYAICCFRPTTSIKKIPERELDKIYKKKVIEEIKGRGKKENPYVRLARMTLENLVLQNSFLTIRDVEDILDVEMLTRKAGTFVCIKKEEIVRGCIGTIIPTTSCIAHEIVNNAINAGYNDPRFNPVSVDELPYLSYTVDILEEPEIIESVDELDVHRYGIIVENEKKRGLLLPNLDAIKSPEQQVNVALKKAGIDKDEKYILQRFEVMRYC